MRHACNIDRSGRLVRLGVGIAALAGALVLLFAWALRGGGLIAWAGVAIFAMLGVLGIYQAYFGWCAARAIGLKTKI